MKIFILLTFVSTLLLSSDQCNKNIADNRFKGRLEIKGICMNYTIKLLEGNIDTTKICSEWTDEMTKLEYEDVFALGSPCNFPATLKEGDEFYFAIDSMTVQNCAVCMAYYPTPPKKLPIKVME